jgi:hypothetical protein
LTWRAVILAAARASTYIPLPRKFACALTGGTIMKYSMTRFMALSAALLLPVIASAAADMYLQIKDAKGETRVVQCAGGACVVDRLAPGQYTVLVCDAQGKVIPSAIKLEYTVVSPRDIATGQASGRRMHKPISITTEMGATAQSGNSIAIDEPGVQLAIGVTADAVDAAAAKISKSRSNIQNN